MHLVFHSNTVGRTRGPQGKREASARRSDRERSRRPTSDALHTRSPRSGVPVRGHRRRGHRGDVRPEVSMEPASQPAPSTSASAAGAPFRRRGMLGRCVLKLRPCRLRPRRSRSVAEPPRRAGALRPDLEDELQQGGAEDQDEQDRERDRGSGSHRAPPGAGGGTTVTPLPAAEAELVGRGPAVERDRDEPVGVDEHDELRRLGVGVGRAPSAPCGPGRRSAARASHRRRRRGPAARRGRC